MLKLKRGVGIRYMIQKILHTTGSRSCRHVVHTYDGTFSLPSITASRTLLHHETDAGPISTRLPEYPGVVVGYTDARISAVAKTPTPKLPAWARYADFSIENSPARYFWNQNRHMQTKINLGKF